MGTHFRTKVLYNHTKYRNNSLKLVYRNRYNYSITVTLKITLNLLPLA